MCIGTANIKCNIVTKYTDIHGLGVLAAYLTRETTSVAELTR